MESNLTAPGSQNPTSALAKVIAVDGKFTRAEAMDILLEDLQAELNAELAKARAETTEAEHALHNGLTLDDVLSTDLSRARVRIDNGNWNSAENRYIPIIVLTMPLPAGNAKIEAIQRRVDAARAAENALHTQMCAMAQSKTAFKTQVLKTMLSGTPEGQAALAALAEVKVAIRAKMTSDKK